MPRQAICVVLFVLILLGFLAVGIASMCQLVSRAYAAEIADSSSSILSDIGNSLNEFVKTLEKLRTQTKKLEDKQLEQLKQLKAQSSPLLHPEFTPEYCADSIAANWALALYAGDIGSDSGLRATGINTHALNMLIDRVKQDCKISEHKAARAVGAAIGELCGKTWPCIRDDVKLGDGT